MTELVDWYDMDFGEIERRILSHLETHPHERDGSPHSIHRRHRRASRGWRRHVRARKAAERRGP